MRNLSRQNRPWVLLNPGPVNVTERVRRALLEPDICHREEEFARLLGDVRRKLLGIFGIARTHTVAVFSGSGTTALEAMLSTFAKENKTILVLSNGVYGDRMKTILEVHDTPVRVLTSGPGEFPDLKIVESMLRTNTSLHAVAMVHHETSTGMLNPIAEVGRLAKKYGKTFLVDAVSSLGAEKIDFKNWSVDFCAGTAGKCLHGFPGVSFVLVSKKEAARLKNRKARTLYLDLRRVLECEEKGDTPFTPAVQIFYAFNRALEELKKEGLARRIQSYAQKSRILERGFRALGLRFLVESKTRSHVLTALWTPSFISYDKLHDRLKKEGFVIYAGQSELKDKIFRVSNLGDVRTADLKRFLLCLKRILAEAS
ncbi:MAG: 2-aminoethylphosphonate aminotransferase [Candidatus Omnitrophota bacterium]